MIIVEKELPVNMDLFNLLPQDIGKEDSIFLDIETTGFSPKYNYIFLIGCIYYKQGKFNIIQWLTEKKEDEYELLYLFNKFVNQYKSIIHYNGNSFDIPFIKKRMDLYKINCNITNKNVQLDIYTTIKPYKNFLNLDKLKLKTIEKYCNVHRNDCLDGIMLITKYKDYISTNDKHIRELLLLHNYDDLLGLYNCLTIYEIIIEINNIKDKKNLLNDFCYDISNGIINCILFMSCNLNININSECTNISFNKEKVEMKISLYEGELKHFFRNFTDYYYLPLEDMAIHKSVSKYVDKNYRKKATKQNCYIKKRGTFIPLYNTINVDYKIFNNSVKEKMNYIELEKVIQDDNSLYNLCLEILSLEIINNII
jgi:uncharacterized protein YprB with RNaseH-like and TPR domain